MKGFYGRFPRNQTEAFPQTMTYGAAISGPYKSHAKTYWKNTVMWVVVALIAIGANYAIFG